MSLILLMSLLIPNLLILLNSIIAKKMIYDREKPSSFECGFDPSSSARVPFSMRFFLIAVIFLIFDVEITLILPIPILMNFNNLIQLTFLLSLFMIILILGLYHEWHQGALEWK